MDITNPTPYHNQACGDCGRSYYAHQHYPIDEACGYFVFRQDYYDLCKEVYGPQEVS